MWLRLKEYGGCLEDLLTFFLGMNPTYVKKPYKKYAVTKKRARASLDSSQVRAIVKKELTKNTELKRVDVNYFVATSNWSGTIHPIPWPTNGITDIQRIGDKINVRKLTMQFRCEAATTQCRLWIFRDKMGNNTAVTNFLDANFMGSIYATHAPIDWDNRHQVELLYDSGERILSSTVGSTEYQLLLKAELPMNRETQFDSGTVNVLKNDYKIIFASNLAPAAGGPQEISIHMEYTDA